MSRNDVIYRRTEAGAAVAATEDPEIPAEYRRILRFLEVEAHTIHLRQFLRGSSDELIRQWLAELEELELIESIPAPAEQDLDLTDRLQVSQIAAAFKKDAS